MGGFGKNKTLHVIGLESRGLITSTVLKNGMKMSYAANAQMQEHGLLNLITLCDLCKTELVAIIGYC